MKKISKYFPIIGTTLGICFFVLFTIFSIVYVICQDMINETIRCKSSIPEINNIASLDLDKEYKSIFVLGCGYVGKNMYYYFYEEIEEAGFMLKKEKTEKVIIHEYDGRPKAVRKYGYIRLYVPKNTIKREIKLNL